MHEFYHRADETIGWIQEKDAALSGQGYWQDLETIPALVRQHQVFETDLAAVKEQVKNKTSHGYDEISDKILKASAPFILSPLTHIFNKVLSSGIFPD